MTEDTQRARQEQLAKRADEERAPAWIPEESGEWIYGELVSITRGPDRGYGRPLIATLETDDGARSVWLFGEVLVGQFKDARPKVGEDVLVKYLGERESEAGRTYKAWRVIVDRPDENIDWDTVDVEGGPDSDDDDLPFD